MTAPFEVASETSEAAAAAVDVAEQEAVVLDCFKSLPDRGLTDYQLECMTGRSHQSVSARRRGLVLKGLVRDSGEIATNPSGRAATIWVLGKETQLLLGAESPRTKRPTRKEIKAALADLGMLLVAYDAVSQKEWALSPEMQKITAWLLRLSTAPLTERKEADASDGAS